MCHQISLQVACMGVILLGKYLYYLAFESLTQARIWAQNLYTIVFIIYSREHTNQVTGTYYTDPNYYAALQYQEALQFLNYATFTAQRKITHV